MLLNIETKQLTGKHWCEGVHTESCEIERCPMVDRHVYKHVFYDLVNARARGVGIFLRQ